MGDTTQNIAEKVTASIIESLEAGIAPWRRTWNADGTAEAYIFGMPYNASTLKPYRGVNILGLWAAGRARGYDASRGWVTFNQARAMGGNVRKGERGVAIVYWKMLKQEREDGSDKLFPMLRYYTVFHVSQCENLPDITPPAAGDGAPATGIEACDALLAKYADAPTISHGGDRAFYSPKLDYVQMPSAESFDTREDYYGTLFHEMAHSTGHESRLNRPELQHVVRFGDEAYSQEELTAELTAAFACAMCGIASPSMVENSAAYLRGWLIKLKEEPRMIITAAARAQKALDYMIGQTEPSGSGADHQ